MNSILRNSLTVASVAAFLTLGAGAAQAASVPGSDQTVAIHFNSAVDANVAHVITQGPIHGVGTEVATDTGPVQTSTLTLRAGTVTIHAVTTDEDQTLNLIACKAVVRFAGTWSVRGGTGAYSTANGEGHFTGTRIIHGARINGICQGPDSGVEPRLVTEDVVATGIAALS